MPSLFGTLTQVKVCDPGKDVIIAVIQMATGSFAKFLGICGLANF